MWGSSMTGWGNGICGWGSSFAHGPWFFGGLLPLLFWGVLLYLVVRLIRHFIPGTAAQQSDGALEVLRRRLASGEINEQEYTALLKTLGKR